MICDKCVHQNACINAYASMGHFVDETKVKDHSRDILQCEQFADKSKSIELPCKLNDLFYIIPTDDNGFEDITRVECLGFQISKPEPVVDLFRKENGKSSRLYQAGFDMFGESIFRTREEAERHLKKGIKANDFTV